MVPQTPIALTIAGSDSAGGAGIQADLKAMSALGVYGASVLTAITAQNTVAVTAVHEVPHEIVAAQIDAVMSDLNVGAVKLGMLFSADIIKSVATSLDAKNVPIVVDPVMVAKSGDALLQDAAIAALKKDILPIARVLTPNLPEAGKLLGRDMAVSIDDMSDQAHALLELGPKAVLMKGGHATGPICMDILVMQDGTEMTFTAPRIDTKNTHGTGCTYSAALAALLASGKDLVNAAQSAHSYLEGAIAAADTLDIGAGHGPVHHFYKQWT